MCESDKWCKARAKHAAYQRREPSKTVLYQIVSSCRDELPRVWEERFQSEYGVLRDEVLETLDQYLNCGILEHGAARVYCDHCKHSFLVGFSCKGRNLCPSCSAKRAMKFAEHLHEEVLEEVEHFHIIFGVAKRVRPYLRYDRRNCSILFEAGWGSIKEQLVPYAGVAGLVLNLQTSGEALNHNPHLHGIMANGLFLPDGSFKRFTIRRSCDAIASSAEWSGECSAAEVYAEGQGGAVGPPNCTGNVTSSAATSDTIVLDEQALAASFTRRVLAGLQAKGLLDAESVAQIQGQEHSGFSVWIGDAFADKERELFVARYIERGPISLDKLSLEHDIVTYTTKDGVAHEFDALSFLALLSCHIPLRGESLTRYFGRYSCRARGERKKQELLKNPAPEPDTLSEALEPRGRPSASWAEGLKRIYEFDPLECPKCKSPMRIIAFIHNPHELEKIMRSMGIPKAQSPPPIPRAPSGNEYEYAQEFPVSEFEYL